MNIKLSYTLVGLTLVAALWASCSDKKPKSGRTDTASSGVISFASDESFSPIIEEEREIFEKVQCKGNAQLTPIYTNESEGMTKLLKSEVYLMITARDYKDDERQSLIDRGYTPLSIILAFDGLSLIQNKENTDSCITVADVTRILNGSVTKWNEIYPGSKKGEITVVFDNKKSSAVHFVEDSILGGKPISNPNVAAVETSEEVINFVEKTPGAIGIIGSNWLDDKRGDSSVARNRNIRTMSVTRLDKATPTNSRKPDQYYIYSREYPLIRTIYALVTDPRRGLPWGFAHFLESPRGQMIIFQTGYMLPYRGDIRLKSVKVNN